MKKIQGFTLIELMVTIAVLAIIAMMAVPSFNNMTAKRKLDTTTREIALLFGEVRSQALALRKNIEIKKCPVVAGKEECPANTPTVYYRSTQMGDLTLSSPYIDGDDVIVTFESTGLAKLNKTELVDNPDFDNTQPDSLTLTSPTNDNPSKIEKTIKLFFTVSNSTLGESRYICVSKVGTVDYVGSQECPRNE